MKNNNILIPFFKTIDKLLFGIDEVGELEQRSDCIDREYEYEFEMEPSAN